MPSNPDMSRAQQALNQLRWHASTSTASLVADAYRAGNTIVALAEAAQVTRPTIYRWLRQHGIQVGDPEAPSPEDSVQIAIPLDDPASFPAELPARHPKLIKHEVKHGKVIYTFQPFTAHDPITGYTVDPNWTLPEQVAVSTQYGGAITLTLLERYRSEIRAAWPEALAASQAFARAWKACETAYDDAVREGTFAAVMKWVESQDNVKAKAAAWFTSEDYLAQITSRYPESVYDLAGYWTGVVRGLGYGDDVTHPTEFDSHDAFARHLEQLNNTVRKTIDTMGLNSGQAAAVWV